MSKSRQATIVDIAKEAGVSIATVSNVLNRKLRPNIPLSEETIRKVEDAAAQLGYRRNVMAASLSRKKTNELGLIVPAFVGYYGRFAETMEKVAHQYGYHLSVFSSGGFNPDIERRHIQMLLERRVDGLFSHGLAMSVEATRMLVGGGTPLVLFNGWGWPEDLAAGAVNLDFRQGARDAVYHLLGSGCKSIVYLGREIALAVDEQRRLGFAEGLQQAPESIAHGMIQIYQHDLDVLVDSVLELSKGVRPIGVLAFDDNYAFRFMTAAMRKGIRVPEEIKVVGINNEPLTADCYPSISTLSIDYQLQATLAVTKLLSHLGEHPSELEWEGVTYSLETHEMNIPMKLIHRQSS